MQSNDQVQSSRPRRRAAPVPAVQTEAGKSAIDALMNRKERARLRGTRVQRIACFTLFCIVALSIIPAWGNGVLVEFLALIAAILLLGTLTSRRLAGMSRTDYYSIPGAGAGAGDHRCIYCANKGIYRHGAYKSDVTYVDCSKCGTNLWTE